MGTNKKLSREELHNYREILLQKERRLFLLRQEYRRNENLKEELQQLHKEVIEDNKFLLEYFERFHKQNSA